MPIKYENKKLIPTATVVPSQLYIAEAAESKERTKKELAQADPDNDKDFETLIAEHEVKNKDEHSS